MSTVMADGRIVPWLAASGPLAYTPENPPSIKSAFQYSWVFPENFPNNRHYYFGDLSGLGRETKSWGVNLLLDFYYGAKTRIHINYGNIIEHELSAPIACYSFIPRNKRSDYYMLIQQGSYNWCKVTTQPEIKDGFLYLYRGIMTATEFCHLLVPESENARQTLKTYFDMMKHSFSDSARAFSLAHSRVARCETGHLATPVSWIDVRHNLGLLELKDSLFISLQAFHKQSFTLQHECAKLKFGKNYVKFRTPLDNIRLTSFFAGEDEVMVIDPRKLEVVKQYGCKVTLMDEDEFYKSVRNDQAMV
jgi:hypothetical protein